VQRLDLDCLDAYPDGTPRLRIPVGKGKGERLVPIHVEAADAIRELQGMACDIRCFRDEHTGIESRRLFVLQGRILSSDYLFEQSLARACEQAGLLTSAGKPAITAHQFRHTVGTELSEGGARLHTIMKMLGHTNTEMTLVYAHISDRAVVEDYQRVLGPGPVLAGRIAEELRAGTSPTESVEWLKANFFKTELELGHCLPLPQEGLCECDLYLDRAKFVTTREYAPLLRARWRREQERHGCAARRAVAGRTGRATRGGAEQSHPLSSMSWAASPRKRKRDEKCPDKLMEQIHHDGIPRNRFLPRRFSSVLAPLPGRGAGTVNPGPRAGPEPRISTVLCYRRSAERSVSTDHPLDPVDALPARSLLSPARLVS
jgi:hypothetical protein